jgi:N-acetylmuramoyl-L-alanine amidase
VFRSVLRLARRAVVAGVAAAIALTLFDVVQPSLGGRPDSGTVTDVALRLTPEPPGPVALAAAKELDDHAGEGRPVARRPAPPVVSQPVDVGKARMVGFSWPDPTPAPTGPPAGGQAQEEEESGVFMRARAGGGWSAWRELEVSAEGPDATSPEYDPDRVYTDGHWLQAGTEEVQVRVDPTAPGAPAAAATPAPAAADRIDAHLVAPDMTPTPGTEAGGPNQAVAATSQPPIISRARWRADERLRKSRPSYSGSVKAAFIHHTVQTNSYSPSESAALVRADYVYHTRTRGWNDVGYNFLVDRFGRIFEGRYGGVTRPVLGAHAGGFNTETTGIALLGTFTSARPPAAMLAATQRLVAWKLDLSHVDPRGRTTLTSRGGANVRYPAGRRVAVPVVLAHRTTSFTACPGNPVVNLLPAIRAGAARIGLPKIFGGSTAGSAVTPGGAAVATRARFSGTVNWTATVTGSNGAPVRTWSGRGSAMSVGWNGRSGSGAAAPAGWATMTVTARAGRASARPVASNIYVRRATPLGGTTTGAFANGSWAVTNRNVDQEQPRSFTRLSFGRQRGDVPIVGDWNGDGVHEVGIVRGNVFHLRAGNGPGSPVLRRFAFGRAGDRFVVGDWDGDRVWTPGVVRDGLWLLRNANSTGGATVPAFRFGRRGDRFLVGDWNGDGRWTPGLVRGAVWHLRDVNGAGSDRAPFRFGRAGDLPFAGDWDGDGSVTPGVLRSGARWYLRNAPGGGGAALGLRKQVGGTPVVGDFDGAP